MPFFFQSSLFLSFTFSFFLSFTDCFFLSLFTFSFFHFLRQPFCHIFLFFFHSSLFSLTIYCFIRHFISLNFFQNLLHFLCFFFVLFFFFMLFFFQKLHLTLSSFLSHISHIFSKQSFILEVVIFHNFSYFFSVFVPYIYFLFLYSLSYLVFCILSLITSFHSSLLEGKKWLSLSFLFFLSRLHFFLSCK